MATQKPLVLIDGQLQQLSDGDTIPGAALPAEVAMTNAAKTWSSVQNFAAGISAYSSNNDGTLSAVKFGRSADQYISFHGGSGGNFVTSKCTDTNPKNFLVSVRSDSTSVSYAFDLSGRLSIPATTGVAPFLIQSTTVVANLNADLLDGQHGAFYQNASNLNAGTVPAARLPAVNWTDQGAMLASDKIKLDGMATGQPGSATFFVSSGTWTRPSLSLFTFCVVELWGAGGGGGGGQRYYSSDRRSGGTGGGGGAYRRMQFLLADLPSSVTVTIGAGGTGGAGSASLGADPGNGQNGGATTFGSILQAYGGVGGGAVPAGSTLVLSGGSGAGVTSPSTANEPAAWGTGGRGGQVAPGSNSNDVGNPSGAAGAGGGAGGGLSPANAAITGKDGGANSLAKAGGTGATTQGGAGGNGALFGEGGGGGGWGLTADAGNGGNGNVAGGGGGGGASTNAYLPGSGGNGGPGRAVIYVW